MSATTEPPVRTEAGPDQGLDRGRVAGWSCDYDTFLVRKVEVLEYPELGMEAVWRIEVEDFPAFILVDDKGNDFYEGLE